MSFVRRSLFTSGCWSTGVNLIAAKVSGRTGVAGLPKEGRARYSVAPTITDTPISVRSFQCVVGWRFMDTSLLPASSPLGTWGKTAIQPKLARATANSFGNLFEGGPPESATEKDLVNRRSRN